MIEMSNMIQAAREQVAQLTQAAYEKAAAAGLLPAGALSLGGPAAHTAVYLLLLALAGLACLGCALGWLWLPVPGPGPDGLLEPVKTKALLPDEWRGELCSSIVSNQS